MKRRRCLFALNSFSLSNSTKTMRRTEIKKNVLCKDPFPLLSKRWKRSFSSSLKLKNRKLWWALYWQALIITPCTQSCQKIIKNRPSMSAIPYRAILKTLAKVMWVQAAVIIFQAQKEKQCIFLDIEKQKTYRQEGTIHSVCSSSSSQQQQIEYGPLWFR